MNFREFILNEMPLASFTTSFTNDTSEEEDFGKIGGKKSTERQVYKDESGIEVSIEGRFSKKDRAALSSNKTLKTLEDRLARSGHNFNIVMFEGEPPTGSGREAKWIRQAETFLKEKGIQTQGHITFVKNGTSGHVLTPWMVLHTMGHAMLNQNPRKNEFREIVADIEAKICGITRTTINDLRPDTNCMRRLGELLMFSSAQPKADETLDKDELYHELIAEYLWHGGRIRTKPQQDPKKDRNAKWIARKFEDLIKNTLDQLVGKVVYDHLG